jgi:probable rRNA maturation factor
MSAVSVDILVESSLWAAEDAETTVRAAIATAADAVRALPAAGGEVTVVLTDDEAIRKLNRDWRHMDKPTNVLSFPAAQLPTPERGGGEEAVVPASLGDLVIAYETTVREATAEAKPVAHHVAHLAVHGFLHLLGYDHESDEEADEMERLEARILARLNIPDPYATRSSAA